MKLLVFGEIGQLGQELQRRAGDVTLEVRGLSPIPPPVPASWSAPMRMR